MARGLFDSLLSNPAYNDANKEWHVSLEESKCIWYDLVQEKPNGFGMRKMVVETMRELEQSVKDHLDKRFVYFLCTRKRVRFCTSRAPRYSLLTGELVLYLEIGQARKKQKISIPIRDARTKRQIKPRVSVTEKYIQIYSSDHESITFPVHDFLNTFDIPIGETSEVHYVGYTSQPSVRPLDGEHRGLNRVLYHNTDGDRDFFLVYNLFKVMVRATTKTNNIEFMVANSMTNEVEAEAEGKILEKALIAYFDSPLQDANRKSEDGELRNSLAKLFRENHLGSIRFQLEMEYPNEYFCFHSESIKAADCHSFICALGASGEVVIKQTEPQRLGMPLQESYAL